MACLAVYMQQILEQYSLPLLASELQREPTHCTNTISLGWRPSLGHTSVPLLGPAAFIRRSNSRLVTTSFDWQ